MSAHTIVKARLAAAHVAIDTAFSRFDLSNEDSYVHFLQTIARVVPAVEAVLHHGLCLPPWRPRSALLNRDLDAFGHRLPKPLAVSKSRVLAENFGLLYVLEGSRLGSHLLLRQVGHGFSSHYLSDTHQPGEWRAFTDALDNRAKAEHSAWVEGVLAGANYGFQLYRLSASEVVTDTKINCPNP